jgi:hypothetical protein
VLKSVGIPHAIWIDPGQGHGFAGEIHGDAARRITAFLDCFGLRRRTSGRYR